MKKIILSGEIGWDIFPDMVREQFGDISGEDIEVDLSSPGGSVFDGIEIFNIFRDYKRDNPGAQMILNMKGETASMGSYIAANETFDIVTTEDNNSWMVHNPIMGIYGDYQEMEKGADFLKRLAKMMVPVYSKRSGKAINEIQKMMDSETWLFGQEIVDAGFADEIIKTDSGIDKDSAIARAELKLKAVMKKVRETEIKESDFEKVAAIMKNDEKKKDNEQSNTQPAAGGNNNQEDVLMDIKELREKHPEIHAEALKAGEDKGMEFMKANNKAVMEFKNKTEFKNLEFIQARCEKALEDGENFSDLKMAVQALMLDPKNQSSLDSPGDLDGGSDGTVSGESGKDSVEMKKKMNEEN